MSRIDNSQGYKLRPANEVGDVVMFVGNEAALNRKYIQGWRIADGSSGTPNLIDSFPKLGTFAQRTGAGGTKFVTPTGAVSVSTSVSVSNHTLSEGQLASHDHAGSSKSNNIQVQISGNANNRLPVNQNTSNAGSSQSHNHGASASSSGSFSGSSHTNEPQFKSMVPLYFTGVIGNYP
jgi:hypothetical protein